MSMPETKPPPKADLPAHLFAVATITFQTDNRVDLPGKPQATSLRASEPTTGKFVRIFYDARLRHHRVEMFEPGPELDRRPTHIRMIPEAWCSWEPA